ncbi:ATP-binding protein [Niveispirillum sp. KHB5.9]|uniref:ATP-binding protein n=1 Tax=Niveispirillum sp. KHB5.9 TaxID=3400269 RepID=UPI003A8B57F2
MPDSIVASHRLDLVHRRLLRDGAPVPLGDRAFDLLVALAAADGAAVPADALTARVWPGVTVSPGNLRVQVRALRRALGDGAVVNVPGVGYRLALTMAGDGLAGHAADPLVGREGELERLGELLSRARLVSVIGPGGVGKTSLALAAAGLVKGLRTVHVELAPIRQPGLLPVVTAAALSLRLMQADVLGTVRAGLAERPTLLLLDNTEHLLDEVAEFADDLLGHCPDLRILLTSREPLGLGGEMLLHLCPLECPPEGEGRADAIRAYPAMRLVLRNHAQAGWKPPGDEQMPALARLCRHLDGLPLALLLLAAWLRDCPVTEVERVLAGRFRDLPLPANAGYRHGNLDHMLDWSVELLTPAERLLLGRLAVFAGAWPVEAAVAVCGAAPLDATAVPGMVAGLVSRSLVAGPIQTRQQGLRLLETIREHVLARDPGMLDREGLRGLLCGWLTRGLRRHMMENGRQSFTTRGLEIDIADIRAMLDWAMGGGDVVAGQVLAIDSYRLWNSAGPFTEIMEYLTRAWDLCGPDTPPLVGAMLGLLLHGEGVPMRLPQHADRPRYAAEDLEAAVATLRGPDVPPTWAIDGLMSAGYIRRYTGDQQACLALWEEAVSIAEAQGIVTDAARHWSLIGWQRAEMGDMAGARADFARSLELAERHDLPRGLTLMRLADAEFNAGQLDRAIALTGEALASPRSATLTLRQTLHANLASYLLVAGRLEEAVAQALPALRLVIELHYSYAHPWTLERGALLALRLGRPALAVGLARLAERLIAEARMKRGGVEKAVHALLAEGLAEVNDGGPVPEVADALAQLLDFYGVQAAGASTRR